MDIFQFIHFSLVVKTHINPGNILKQKIPESEQNCASYSHISKRIIKWAHIVFFYFQKPLKSYLDSIFGYHKLISSAQGIYFQNIKQNN